MIEKSIFLLAHEIGYPGFYSVFKSLSRNQFKKRAELDQDQDASLRSAIKYAYEEVPYYHELMRSLNLKPEDIRRVSDLRRLPILTKEVIRSQWEEFKPRGLNNLSYYDRATGGSRGTPLKYRLEKRDRFLSAAIQYRGWSYGGYSLGEKMAFLGGSSIGTQSYNRVTTALNEFARNTRMLSAFDMNESETRRYCSTMRQFKPRFLYGYASSIHLLSKSHVSDEFGLPELKAVFTTSEKLFPEMRKSIEKRFRCPVYDNYGANDGGATAFECDHHCGLHIDTERSVMEVVDEHDDQLEEGVGRIIATSLFNRALPFIRYDTGDLARITPGLCSCGRESRIINELVGREYELLQTPEGKIVHGEFFSHIFWNVDGVKEFRVVQKALDKLEVSIVPETAFDERQLADIAQAVGSKSPRWNVEFKLVDRIDKTRAGKHKFVINELNL